MRSKLKRNIYIYIYMLVISFLFAISFHIARNTFPVGDQIWFKTYAQQIHYQYLHFGIERYFTWSSRLLIESLTMFSSVHERLFPIIVWFATVLLLSVSRRLSPSLPLVPGLLLFVFFPLPVFASAGIIPTYINYLFPASLFIFAVYYRKSSKLILRVFSLLTFLLVIMQEQLAVYAFLWLVFEWYREFTSNKTSKSTLIYVFVASLGIASAKFAPGNAARIAIETVNWFPTFKDFNLIQKISLGVLETGQYLLTISKSFVFVMVFLGVLVVLGILKKKYASVLIVSIISLLMFLTRLGINTPLTFLFTVSEEVRKSKEISLNLVNIGVVAGYVLIFALLVVYLYMVLDEKHRTWIVYLFCIGLACRMLVSFSPTIYASGSRTMLPFMLSSYIITCHLLNEIWEWYQKKNSFTKE